MTPIPQPFTQAENDWNLTSLCQDLTSAKQQISGKPKQLTPLEITCLKGLLCGYSPSEIAAAINREVRGLRVDLSRGLYRYIEVLTKRPSNTLKDWREVAAWLAKANYKTSFSQVYLPNNDSLIKIVDISLEGSVNFSLIDFKVRNIGNQVAFLKNAKFLFHNIWVLKSWVSPRLKRNFERACPPAPAMAMQRSRTVPPSCNYQVSLPAALNFNVALPLNVVREHYLNKESEVVLIKDIKISQCVSFNDVDRFTFSLFLPKNEPQLSSKNQLEYLIHQSYIYHFKIEIIYDEDNKTIQSGDLILLLEPKYTDNLEVRNFGIDSESNLPGEIQDFSNDNKQIFTEIAKITGVRSSSLNFLIEKYSE
ncbi:MAG: hypothetical protein PUP90_05410 [Nostoc sp. S4]|nr:hypothetical protein [Nostoc sp. S4]